MTTLTATNSLEAAMTDNKRLLATIAWAYIAFAVVMSLLYVVVGPDARTVVWFASMLAILPAVVAGRRYHGLPPVFIVCVVTVGSIYVVAGVLDGILSGTAKIVAQALVDLLGKTMTVAALVIIVSRRRGRFTAGDMVDGVIIALGAWLVAWIGLVEGYASGSDYSSLEAVLDAMYVPASVPVIALAAIFLFSGHTARLTNWAFATSILAIVTGDLLYAVADTRRLADWTFILADVIYIVAFASAGAAFVHPTAKDLLAEHVSRRRRVRLPVRLLVTTFALVAPVIVLTLAPSATMTDQIVRGVSVLALVALTGFRLYQSTRDTLRAQDEMLAMARTDDLTSLPNKSALLETATDVIDNVWRTETQPALFLFDIDRFRNINDSLGHAAGDEVLQVVASRLTLAAESIGATVARPSGDEFLVLDPTPTSPGQALAHAELLHSVFSEPMSIRHGAVFVTASVGVAAMRRGHPLPAEELFRQADISMYRAKDAGRNCLALYDKSMQDRVSHRMKTETELHGALDRREFRLFHQPIVDADSGRVSGFEALIRWQKADGTMVSPAEFIPIAEETGIITSIGSWALLEALTQLRRWLDDDVIPEHATMSVNVSPRQLEDPHFTDIVEEALVRSKVPAHLLWLEVTESMMIDNPELARSTLQRIRSLGVRIALDDFGTGYSSLSLLQQFPLQRIKIDRTFVDGITKSSNDRSLIRTIIGLGDSLGLDIVAEGVETVDQLQMLRALGCAKAQGFLISHPVPADAMRSTISALQTLSEWPEFKRLLGDATLIGHPDERLD